MPLLSATARSHGARAFPHDFLHSLCPSTSHPQGAGHHSPDENTALLTVLLLATAHTPRSPPHPAPASPAKELREPVFVSIYLLLYFQFPLISPGKA